MRRIRSLSGQMIVFLIISIGMYTLATLFALYGARHLEKMLRAEIHQLAYERARITKRYMDDFVSLVPELAQGLEKRIRFLDFPAMDKLSESVLVSLAIHAACLRDENGEIVESLVLRPDGTWNRESARHFERALRALPGRTAREAGGNFRRPAGLLQAGGEWWYVAIAPVTALGFAGDVCFFRRLGLVGLERNFYGAYGVNSISAVAERSNRSSDKKIDDDVWLHFDPLTSTILIEYEDILGREDYFLEIPFPMTVYRKGMSHVYSVFIAMYCAITVGILLLYCLLRSVLLTPLVRLTQDVAERTAKPSELENRSGCLELEILTERINEMLRSGARHNQELEKLAYSDTLTDLKNRRYFMNALTERLKEPLAPGRFLALFLLDVKNFKLVNEAFGYDTGDCVLKAIAGILADNLNDMEHISRLFADEYAMMCECESEDEAREKAERIIHLFLAPIAIGGHTIYLTVAVGNCLYPRDGTSRSSLFRCLDMAVKKAKQQKGNAYQPFDRSIADEMAEVTMLERDLRLAVENETFELWYQPKLSIKDRRVTGCEALLRWNRAGRYIPPDKVISMARSRELIIPLSLWVAAEAARAASAFEKSGFPISVSFNAPIEVIIFEDFLPVLSGAIGGLDLPAGRLVMEITEDALVPDIEKVGNILSGVRSAGCRVSVDDFGTGYSSLSYLHRLQIDELKVDRAFVSRLPGEKAVVETIVAMSRSLGLDVVAEGVERYEQLEYLASIGCDFIQGYLVSKPKPLEHCMRSIREINDRGFVASGGRE